MKTYVYIDAFNLYFGCVKRTPYNWLDLSKLGSIPLGEGYRLYAVYECSTPRPRPVRVQDLFGRLLAKE